MASCWTGLEPAGKRATEELRQQRRGFSVAERMMRDMIVSTYWISQA